MKPQPQIRILQMVPKRLLSRIVGTVAQSRASKWAIPFFVQKYGIRVEEAALAPDEYPSLLDFFCRELKPELRPIHSNPSVLVSPVDGRIAACGLVRQGTMIQAKGVCYSVERLLGGAEMAKCFEGGLYSTLYLSPTDYHRVHAPFAGAVVRSTYIPGTLWPVNRLGVEGVRGLFERNERLVTYLSTAQGLIALVKVGAFIVGGVRVNYDDAQRTNQRWPSVIDRRYTVQHMFDKGEQVGRFEFGSTVIILTEPGRFDWLETVQPGQAIRMGEPLMRAR